MPQCGIVWAQDGARSKFSGLSGKVTGNARHEEINIVIVKANEDFRRERKPSPKQGRMHTPLYLFKTLGRCVNRTIVNLFTPIKREET